MVPVFAGRIARSEAAGAAEVRATYGECLMHSPPGAPDLSVERVKSAFAASAASL